MDNLAQKYIERYPVDASRTIELYPDQDKATLLTSMAAASIAALLRSMPPADAGHCLSLVDIDRAIDVLQEMPPNLAAGCLRRIPGELRNTILEQARDIPELKKMLQQLRFSPRDAGSVMDPDFLVLQQDMTVKQAIAFIKRYPDKLQHLIFIIDQSFILKGQLQVTDLLLSGPETGIKVLSRPCPYTLAAHAHVETIDISPGWQLTGTLPVVDSQNTFLGALTRTALDARLNELDEHNPFSDPPGEILLGLAETFVNTCSEIFFPDRKK